MVSERLNLPQMSQTPVVTRFAPSPTGALHIGGARTALFNWLYARGRDGKFLLRIEDTDRARSTSENTRAILDGLTWLGLDWDGEPISQAEGAERHAEVARRMLADGTAYKCFATQEEIEAFREEARAAGGSTLYRSPWRDVAEADHPDAPFVIRIKAPREARARSMTRCRARSPSATTNSTTWCFCARTARRSTCSPWWSTIMTWA